jgi:hypothetical protein
MENDFLFKLTICLFLLLNFPRKFAKYKTVITRPFPSRRQSPRRRVWQHKIFPMSNRWAWTRASSFYTILIFVAGGCAINFLINHFHSRSNGTPTYSMCNIYVYMYICSIRNSSSVYSICYFRHQFKHFSQIYSSITQANVNMK